MSCLTQHLFVHLLTGIIVTMTVVSCTFGMSLAAVAMINFVTLSLNIL